MCKLIPSLISETRVESAKNNQAYCEPQPRCCNQADLIHNGYFIIFNTNLISLENLEN